MDGVFIKQRFTNISNILGLISGVLLVLFFGFFICIGEYSTLDDVIISFFFVCFGLFVSILCGISLYVNQKANIHVDDQRIFAFCHFGPSLECDLSDVSSVLYGGTGLCIQLKNGKKYNVMNLENAVQIGKYIQKRIAVELMPHLDKDEMIAAIAPLRKKRKYEGIASIICYLLLIPGIYLTAALTGNKELHEFTSYDWSIFLIIAGMGVITIIVSCFLLRKYLLHTAEMGKLQAALYQVILRTAPLRPGNAIKLFVDDDGHEYIRLTVFGYPNLDDVYFTVESITRDYEIECIYSSRVYANINELLPEIEGITEITLP